MRKESTVNNIALMNKKRIYSHLYQSEPLSRADLSKQLGISFPTISANIRDMIEAGLIYEEGMGNTNNVGRNSTLLRISRDYAFLICGSISIRNSELALADIKGNIIRQKTIPTPRKSLDELIGEIRRFQDESLEEYPQAAGKLKAVSIGMHGIRDVKRSKNYLHRLNDITDIEEEIAKHFGCVAVVDNDVNMAVVGEWWKCGYGGTQNIVYINVGDGIGAGIMLNGQLYKSNQPSTGEIGNIVLDFGQMFRQFNDDGAFESLVVGGAAKNELGQMLSLISDNRDADCTLLSKILRSNKVFVYFTMMLINVSCLLNPDVIILGGEYGQEFGQIAGVFRQVMEEYTPSSAPEIVSSGTGSLSVIYGAAYTGLDSITDQIHADMEDM